MTLNVLMNAGPWLRVPPPGYGGIENVVATLVPELRRRGVRVVLATVGSSELPVDEYVYVYPDGQFGHIQSPYNQVMGIAHAHMQRVVAELRKRGDIDLVHDHLEAVGLSVLSAMGDACPPTLHTLHWDLGKHAQLYGPFDGGGRIFVNGVSRSQLERAPDGLRRHSVGWAHLATPLADTELPAAPKGEDLLVLGRITPLKGQHVAARVCQKLGLPLVLAGPVAGLPDAETLAAACEDETNPRRWSTDVRYYLDAVFPYLDGELGRWIGMVAGAARDRLLATARAALFPVQWEEPGGTAVVEALASGTPVIALRRGVLPELIEHGRTGFLADSEEELAEYVLRVDEIDPAECRQAAARRFSPAVMAERYLELYDEVLARAGRATRSA